VKEILHWHSPWNLKHKTKQKTYSRLVELAHTYNPSYLGSRDGRISVEGHMAKILARGHLKEHGRQR
jgi:hypothetical protein